MILLKALVLALTGLMIVVTLIVAVVILLGMGWLAVAIPVLGVIGIVAAGRMLWRRLAERGSRASGDAPPGEPPPGP